MAKIKKMFYFIVFLYFSVIPKSNFEVVSEEDWDDDMHLFI